MTHFNTKKENTYFENLKEFSKILSIEQLPLKEAPFE